MDPRERYAGLEEALRMAARAERLTMWTTLPGIVVSFDPVAVTAVVQPALRGVVQATDGTAQAVDLPLLPDVPVVFPRGGGVTLTFPIAEGDECLLHFSCRCIDGWWQSGGVQLPMEPRLHDLSDAFCVVGPQSQVEKIDNLSTTTAQLRSDDGEAFIELDPGSHDINVVTPGDVTVNCAALDLVATGDVTAEISGGMTATITGALSVTAASTTINGPVTINGSLHVIGPITSDVSVVAPQVTGTAEVTFGSHNATTHVHTFGTKPIVNTTGAPV